MKYQMIICFLLLCAVAEANLESQYFPHLCGHSGLSVCNLLSSEVLEIVGGKPDQPGSLKPEELNLLSEILDGDWELKGIDCWGDASHFRPAHIDRHTDFSFSEGEFTFSVTHCNPKDDSQYPECPEVIRLGLLPMIKGPFQLIRHEKRSDGHYIEIRLAEIPTYWRQYRFVGSQKYARPFLAVEFFPFTNTYHQNVLQLLRHGNALYQFRPPGPYSDRNSCPDQIEKVIWERRSQG